jgi:hypothetical protein
MADAQLKQVKQFVEEAIQLSQKDREKHVRPGDPVSLAPPWPYVSDDQIGARVSRELASPEESQKQLIARLEAFRYPYEAWRPHGAVSQGVGTFYSHVKSLGLLDFLITPPFLWDVRRVWFFSRYHDIELEQRLDKKSQYGGKRLTYVGINAINRTACVRGHAEALSRLPAKSAMH